MSQSIEDSNVVSEKEVHYQRVNRMVDQALAIDDPEERRKFALAGKRNLFPQAIESGVDSTALLVILRPALGAC